MAKCKALTGSAVKGLTLVNISMKFSLFIRKRFLSCSSYYVTSVMRIYCVIKIVKTLK